LLRVPPNVEDRRSGEDLAHADTRQQVPGGAVEAYAPTVPNREGDIPLERGSALGRYVILERLGSGGMGVVFSAYDPDLDRSVAIKLLRPDASASVGSGLAQERLVREARAMARLSHPNVLAVFDVGTFGDRVFVAMELVKGTTLRAWVGRGRSPREVVHMYLQAGRGLAAAHAQGFVHRDFKPDNVLVDGNGRARVLDFGLVREVGDLAVDATQGSAVTIPTQSGSSQRIASPLTVDGAVLGTPAYMAPEQLLGQPTDVLADQFSFCMSLYEALYGEGPFAGETIPARVAAITVGEIRSPLRATRVPAWLRRVVVRGLRAKPHERYPDMATLLAALERDRTARRRSAGLVVAALACVAGVFAVSRRHEVPLCAGAERDAAAAWNPAARHAMRAAFAATGKPYAEAAYETAASMLDVHAAKWVQMDTSACLATRQRGTQSEDVLDLRVACLSRKLEELRTLAALFGQADAPVVEHAVSATSSLELGECADIESLKAPVRPPRDPAVYQRVDALRLRLTEAETLRKVGRYKASVESATATLADARATGYEALLAEAQYRLGSAQEGAGDYAAAEQSLLDAAYLAQATRQDDLAAQAWEQLVMVAGVRLGKPEEAVRWMARQAASLRKGRAASDEGSARLARNLGVVLGSQERFDEAQTELQRALDLYEKTLGPEHMLVATSLKSLGNLAQNRGQSEQALLYYRRALAIQERVLGLDHPEVASVLHNMAGALVSGGKTVEALATEQRALNIWERALGPDHPDLSFVLGGLGQLYDVSGRHAEALASYQRALAIREMALGPDNPLVAVPLLDIGRSHRESGQSDRALAPCERALRLREKAAAPGKLAEARFELAQALSDARRDPVRARDLALLARAGYASLGAAKAKELAAVDRWLKDRP
jgi:tetratricopeptide (TPR) repeat protein